MSCAFYGWRRNQELAKEIDDLRGKISSNEQKNQELDELMNYFGTADFMEREARLRLNLRLPGEQVVILPGAGDQADSSTAGGNTYEENWQEWWNYFFKR